MLLFVSRHTNEKMSAVMLLRCSYIFHYHFFTRDCWAIYIIWVLCHESMSFHGFCFASSIHRAKRQWIHNRIRLNANYPFSWAFVHFCSNLIETPQRTIEVMQTFNKFPSKSLMQRIKVHASQNISTAYTWKILKCSNSEWRSQKRSNTFETHWTTARRPPENFATSITLTLRR